MTPELPTSRSTTGVLMEDEILRPPKPDDDWPAGGFGSFFRSWISRPSPVVVWSGSWMTTCESVVICWVASSNTT